MKYIPHLFLYIGALLCRGQVVGLLNDVTGNTHLTIASRNRWGIMHAHVYPFTHVGDVILHDDGTTSGNSCYISHWKKY